MPDKPEDQEKEKMDYVQFRIPESKKALFEQIVMQKHGLKHGGKTLVFLEMIDDMAAKEGLQHFDEYSPEHR